VVHAAAAEDTAACEKNPFEAVKTNVLGAGNVIEAAIERGVERVLAISSTEAASPASLHGATRLCAEKLFTGARNDIRAGKTVFAVVRLADTINGPRAIIPTILQKGNEPHVEIPDARVTRFSQATEDSVQLALTALERMTGGEVFVPKTESYRILDVAEAMAPGCDCEVTGIGPGLKLHDELITSAEGFRTVEFDDYFVILPPIRQADVETYIRKYNGRRCPDDFSYASDTNMRWMGVDDIRRLLGRRVTMSAGTPSDNTGQDLGTMEHFYSEVRQRMRISPESLSGNERQGKGNSRHEDNYNDTEKTATVSVLR
jgi:FlaA1/EpsC-like NDP-sugar epimerase